MIKPTEDPKAAEPDQPTSTPQASEQLEDPAPNIQLEMPELSVDDTNIDLSTTESSSSLNPP